MFSSARERRLWIWAAVSLIAIYASLAYVRAPTEWLRERNLLRLAVAAVFLVAVALIASVLARRRPGRTELFVLAAAAVAYLGVLLRMERVEERVHFLEYGLVGGLVYAALLERWRRGPGGGAARGRETSPGGAEAPDRPVSAGPARGRFPWTELIAIFVTAAAGWGDEGIQAILPNRVYELRDVGLNVAAGILVVTAMAARSWARRRDSERRAAR